jgi:hypothetical protein
VTKPPLRQSSNETKSADLKGLRATPKGGRKTTQVAKDTVLKLLRDGNTREQALAHVGRSIGTWKYWKRSDPDFSKQADFIIGARTRKGADSRKEVPDFPEFCEEYLGFRLFWHQLQWFDVLEGRAPRDLHPSQKFLPGADPHLLLVNVPPGHAKSTTITAAYVLWRLMKNPNAQIVLVSKNEPMAKKWMFQIQDWLTSRSFEKLQTDFGPEGGFEKTSPIWNKTQIYFGPQLRDENAKDPTLEVLGMGGTIYGARADLIILDDVVATENAHDFENQIEWLTGMVLTRPSDEDKVLIVGTRVAPQDLYRELMNPSRYDDEEPPWTYFASPAVLEFTDDPKDWVTLWPRSNVVKRGQVVVKDEDGLYPKWDGPSLARMRKRLSTNPRAWTLNYQQEEVSADSIFPREQVYGCVQGMRKVGPLIAGATHHPDDGMAGKRVIAGLDPASAGHTAAVVIAFDPDTRKRWLLDAYNKPNTTPAQTHDLMVGWAERYGVREWRIEKVLNSQYITQDLTLARELATLGCTMHDHITTRESKWDADTGILSLSSLVIGGDQDPKTNLLQIPSVQSENIRALCEQMVTYFPKTKGLTDLLMALWFVESRLRELEVTQTNSMFRESPFASGMDRQYQRVIDLNNLDPDDQLVEWSPFHQRRVA